MATWQYTHDQMREYIRRNPNSWFRELNVDHGEDIMPIVWDTLQEVQTDEMPKNPIEWMAIETIREFKRTRSREAIAPDRFHLAMHLIEKLRFQKNQ